MIVRTLIEIAITIALIYAVFHEGQLVELEEKIFKKR